MKRFFMIKTVYKKIQPLIRVGVPLAVSNEGREYGKLELEIRKNNLGENFIFLKNV